MNKGLIFGIALSVGLFGFGCGGDSGSSTTSGDSSTGGSQSGAGSAADSVINHARDLQEFELKKSLSGLESLIGDLKDKGVDVSKYEAQKADLEKKLKAL